MPVHHVGSSSRHNSNGDQQKQAAHHIAFGLQKEESPTSISEQTNLGVLRQYPCGAIAIPLGAIFIWRYVFSGCTPGPKLSVSYLTQREPFCPEALMHRERVPLSMLCMLAALSAVLGTIHFFIHP